MNDVIINHFPILCLKTSEHCRPKHCRLPFLYNSKMSDAASTPEVALFEDDPGSLDGVIDDEDEDLKLDNADTKVWLVKVSLLDRTRYLGTQGTDCTMIC